MTRWILLRWAVLLMSVAICVRADDFVFSVLPSTEIVSPPGALVGWGYRITNQSATDWLVTTSLNSDAFLYGTATPLFDFPVIAPNQTVAEPFDPVLQTGLYDLRWDTNAPDGATNAGEFSISAEWWTGDPANGGAFVAAAADSVQPYSATVTAIPEPITASLLIAAFCALAAHGISRKVGGRATDGDGWSRAAGTKAVP